MKQLAALFILCVTIMHSQTPYMNIHTHGGSTTSIPIHDIHQLTFSGITEVGNDRVSTTIKSFTLLQNYPNPFNPTTTIEYQLSKPGEVQIKIFSLTGQLVRTIESTRQTQGTHVVVWDAKNNDAQPVASGLYVYQVAFENTMLAKKMLFIK